MGKGDLTIEGIYSESELEKRLRGYDLPKHRKINFNKSNLTWLDRNIGIQNSEKDDFKEVQNTINRMIQNKLFSN